VELKAGVKYCDFCGKKVAADVEAASPAARPARGTAGGLLKGIAVGCLAIGILAYVGNRLKEQAPPPAPPPSAPDGKRQAAAACEAAIRKQAPAPFRVIAFRSTLVAEETPGYTVSGSVELQSAAGELQRKRYFCSIHPDASAGMVVKEGKIY
jgi:hypothetical protein